MAVRLHTHKGATKPHPVYTRHKSEATKTAHEHELRVHSRNTIKASWKKPVKSKDELVKLKEPKQPSTMDKATRQHFSKIVGKLITKHQEKHNLSKNYVRQGFHQVTMPIAYRKLKETHVQKQTGGKWKKLG